MNVSTSNGLRILSLDGGEARCMSQLVLLNEFMHRLELDTGQKLLVCEYFDFIIGTGAGGVIAAFLVTFRMTIEDAMKSFARVCNSIFAQPDYTPAARTEKLRDTLKQLMEEYQIPVDNRLLKHSADKQDPADRCKLALCYVPVTNLAQLRLFRNYSSRQASYSPSTLQAMLAAWATPNLFLPVSIGPEFLAEEVISAATGFNNPSQDAMKEVYEVFGSSAQISCFLSLGAGRSIRPPSLSSDTTPLDVFKTFEQLAMDCDSVAKEVERRIGRLGIYFRLCVDRGLDFAVHSINAGRLGDIASYTSSYLLDDAVSKTLDDCLFKAEHSSRITLETLYQAKSAGLSSAHGLPPLSAFFVMREQVMKEMKHALLEGPSDEQHDGARILVLSGMGGCGKTQMTLKFARDHEDKFQHILFIDASSAESIKNGIISRVRSIGREYERQSVEEALEVLSEPDEVITRDWCMIFDNADDANIRISDYFPVCDHGSIIISTRNVLLGDLAPDAHIHLDVMSPEEASDALLKAAFIRDHRPTDEERMEAQRIVEHLGFLPVAIIQAGCFIKQQHCLRQYLELLKTNRRKLLERPTRVHRDKLKYDHSVYAAFDVTLETISARARQLLGVLSILHFTDFPRPLFSIAAKCQFQYEPNELLDRPPSFQDTINFLNSLLCPSGAWDESELVNLLEELQKYSLVVLVPSEGGVVTLRFHPLQHAWSRDRMTDEEFTVHQAAAVRLLVCGTDWENEDLFKYISPHVNALSPVWNTLHANDRSAFAQIIRNDGQAEVLMQLLQGVYGEVKEVYGEQHLRTSRAALDLADAFGEMGDTDTMERMEREVVALRGSLLGQDHLETVGAELNLSGTLYDKEEYAEVETLQLHVLDTRKRILGICHKDTAEAMIALAETYDSQERITEAVALQSTAVDSLTTLLGRTHIWTLDAIVGLTEYYRESGNHTEADKLQQEVLNAEKARLGTRALEVLSTMEWIATAYVDQGRYSEAARLWEEIVNTRREVQSSYDLYTLNAIGSLARVYTESEQGRLVDAERLRREEIEGRRALQGAEDDETLNATFWLARTLLAQKKFTEAEQVMKGVVESRKKISGEENIDYLNALAEMARIVHESGNYVEAEKLRRYEMEHRTSLQRLGAPETLNAMTGLARALLEQKKQYPEAESLLTKELELRTKLQGEGSVDTLNCLSWVVRVYFEEKRYGDGEKAARRLLEGRRLTSGARHIETLNAIGWLARCIQEQGRLQEAEGLRNEELALRRDTQGKTAPYYNTLSWLVKLYLDQNRISEMEKAAAELLVGRKEILPPRHADVASAMRWLSRAFEEEGRYEEASKLLEEALPIFKEAKGFTDIDTLNTLERLIMTSHGQGQFDVMLKYAEEHLTGKNKVFGDDSVEFINARGLVGWAILCQGRYAEAVDIFQQLLVLRQEKLGAEHVNAGITKKRLAEAYHAMGRDNDARALAKEALFILKKTLKPEDAIMKEMLNVVQKIEGPASLSGPASSQAAHDSGYIDDQELTSPDVGPGENVAPDPDDETHQPQSVGISSPAPIPRLRTPFEVGLGRQPRNPWFY